MGERDKMGEARAFGAGRWRASLSVLANRNFFCLWVSGGLCTLSMSVLNIALMKLIYDQTNSAGGVGLLVFTNIISMVIATPVAGVLADRLDRKKMMVGIGLLRAVFVLLFLGARSPLLVYTANLARAMANMLNMPARSAAVPDLIKKEQLLDANALDLSLATVLLVVGPLLGGFIIDQFSIQAVFVLCALLYLLATVCLLLVRLPPPSLLRGEASLRVVYDEFLEGVRYARINPVVSAMIIIYLVFLTGMGLRLGLDMVFAEQVLSSESLPPATAYSYMMSVMSAGTFIGSQGVRYLARRFPKKQLLLVGLGMAGLEAIGLALARNLPQTMLTRFSRGLGNGLSESVWPTLLQENVEESKLGRAFSVFVGVVTIPPAVTVYLGGWLADHTSLQLVYGLTGGWVLLTIIGSRFLPGYRAIPSRAAENAGEL
jgi:MFS family permease